MMNMRDEYLIHKTHRTFRAWLLPFTLLADNLNAISWISEQKKRYYVLLKMHFCIDSVAVEKYSTNGFVSMSIV
jgi:hypothetical protein